MSLKDRISNAWNAFQTENDRRTDSIEPTTSLYQTTSPSYYRQDRYRLHFSNERSILNSIYNRIANDIASIQIQHIRVDENDRFVETINSGLNRCMTLSANLDQTARDFWVDLILSMLDEGVVAGVAVDTNIDYVHSNSFDILSLRVGKIIEWYPGSVKLEVYNERTGTRETLTLPKDKVAILENPFYSVMNEPNSTLKRLIQKMNILDQIDGQKASSKLNLLVQLPYSLKSPTRLKQAEDRRKVLEDQLEGSRYGVAYIDSTEHVTQLNRAIENDLPQQITALTDQLYAQIGIGAEVFKGTATPQQILMYNKKCLKPILDLIEQEFTRKFLTQTAITQGQKIGYFIDAFDLVTPDEVGAMANSLSRNEIVSANEFRGVLGLKPSDNPRADELLNKNMPQNQAEVMPIDESGSNEDPGEDFEEEPLSEDSEEYIDESENQNGFINNSDEVDAFLDQYLSY